MADPIVVTTDEDLANCVQQMKQQAMGYPINYKPEYPTTEEAYADSIKQVSEAPPLNSVLLFLDYAYAMTSVCLTYDKYEEIEDRWHLSMLTFTPSGQTRTRDDIANRIALAFLGENFKEIPCEGVMIKEVRHFEVKYEN